MSRETLFALPARVGAGILSVADQVGGMTLLLGQALRRLFPPRVDRYELVRNLHRMGVQSLPIVIATAAFTGAIMVIQAAPLVIRFNARAFIGWGASFVTFREVGPLLIALMFNGRVGANNAAELGTMVVTEQVDGLRALAIDPIGYLVTPRILAMVVMIVALTVLGDGVAVIGSMITGDLLLDVHPRTFIASALPMLGPWDVIVGLIKSAIFGLMIALTSCYFGLSTRGGAPGVGRSVNASVVAAASGIFVADYLSTFVLG
ncbi:MAG: ABC transporter permease [Deltaproteobacteria bacterium]|nr:ABC transporter permease [Deltaproteobacteria bacterium]